MTYNVKQGLMAVVAK